MKTGLPSQTTRVRTWLSATVLGTGTVFCGAVLAAIPISSRPLVTTDWLAQNLGSTRVCDTEASVKLGLGAGLLR